MAHLWVNDSDVHFSPKLSQYLRSSAQPVLKFRQFADVKDAMGKEPGDSFNFPKVGDVSTIGGTLVETDTMPTSNQSITKGTLSIDEYGNAIPFTFKIDTLSQFDLESIIEKGLKDDMVKVLDAAVEAQFDACKLRYVASGTATNAITTNGTATATNNSELNEYHIRKMQLELEKRNVPGFEGDTHVLVTALESVESLKGAMVSIQQYSDKGYQKIMNGECGMVHNVRIVKDNNATRYTYDLTNRTKTAKSWTNGKGLEGYMVGKDTVMEGVAVPEQIRAKEVTDYGRSKGLAWYFLGGWKLIWDDEPNAKIIKYDSAA